MRRIGSFHFCILDIPHPLASFCAQILFCAAVVESYGLTQHTDEDQDQIDEDNKKWRVDESLLCQASTKKSELYSNTEKCAFYPIITF